MKRLMMLWLLASISVVSYSQEVETSLGWQTKALTDEVTVTFANISVPTGDTGNLVVEVQTYTEISNGTDRQVVGNRVQTAVINSSGTPEAVTFTTDFAAKNQGTGTLTQTVGSVGTSGNLALTWVVNTSLSGANIKFHYKIKILSASGITVSPA